MNNLSTLVLFILLFNLQTICCKNGFIESWSVGIQNQLLIKLDANVFSKHDSSQEVIFDILKYSDS